MIIIRYSVAILLCYRKLVVSYNIINATHSAQVRKSRKRLFVMHENLYKLFGEMLMKRYIRVIDNDYVELHFGYTVCIMYERRHVWGKSI